MTRIDPLVSRELAEEVPVALVYNGATQAVMMASPRDLEDFGIGFSMSEGIIERPEEIEDIEIIAHPIGQAVTMWLDAPRAERLADRKRALAGPVGCGLCGIESLEAAVTPIARIGSDRLRLNAGALGAALSDLRAGQSLHDATGAAHAAGLWDTEVLLLREDIGRHNALDKLIGATARTGLNASGKAVVLTSRVSTEMVQKTAALGAEAILSPSAPTDLAVRLADEAGITLITNIRGNRYRLLTHPHRLEDQTDD